MSIVSNYFIKSVILHLLKSHIKFSMKSSYKIYLEYHIKLILNAT